jgi:hypothetical protein
MAKIRIALNKIARYTHLAFILTLNQRLERGASRRLAKLISPIWRIGRALPDVLSTYSHSHPWIAQLVSQHIWLALAASWSVIIFECLFPRLLFGHSQLAVLALVCGFSFHAGCAVFMGLSSFLWGFPATYPCVPATVFYWKALI